MARVFTINVPYEGKTHTALVSLSESYDLSFSVRCLDDVTEMIPERKIVVSLSEDLAVAAELTRMGQGLVYQTTEVIRDYLNK